jgi:hypothetical protein
VDRVFSMKGFGTVVGGTGLSGVVKPETPSRSARRGSVQGAELGVNDTGKAASECRATG